MGHSSLAIAQNTQRAILRASWWTIYPLGAGYYQQIGVGGPGVLSSKCLDSVTVAGGGLRVDKKGWFVGSSRVQKHIYISSLFLLTLHPIAAPSLLSSQFPPPSSPPFLLREGEAPFGTSSLS